MSSLKAALRKRFRVLRLEMDGREKLRLDDLLLIQFQRLSFDNVQRVLTYWPMVNTAEPNTHLFNGWLRHSIPDVEFCYPRMNGSDLELIAIDEDTVYLTHSWGVTEPKKGVVVSPASIDMVITPLLACNAQGYRLGYGKGYYDRLINQCREDVLLIGFGYEPPVADAFQDEWDIPIHYYVTPHTIHVFDEEG